MKDKSLKNLLKTLKPHTGLIIVSLLFGLINVLCSLLIPLYFGKSVDKIVDIGLVDFNSIKSYLIMIGSMVIVSMIAQYLMSLTNSRIVYLTVRDLRNQSFSKLSTLPLSSIDSKSTGMLVNNIISDIETAGDGILMAFTQLFTGILTIIGVIVFMLTINLYVSLAVILITPISLFIARMVSKKSYSSFKAQSTERGTQTALINEFIGNQKIVQSYSYEDDALVRFNDSNEKLATISLKATFISSIVNPSTRLINAIIYAVVVLIGGIIITNGTDTLLTIGALSTLLGYVNQYTKPFNEITSVVTELQNSLACLSNVYKFTDEKDDRQDEDDIKLNVPETIRINDISFSYVKEKPLIENFSLDIKRGERIAIVGPTGCGKTTFINLLMRFYDVNSGEILFDGIDIENVKKENLRNLYGMVLQDTWIPSGTIKEIISMGDDSIPLNDIIEATKKAKIYHFINQLPEKFDTYITESSNNLSAGERQLICIARVMLKNPDILILDEATSNIDTRTEQIVQKAFLKLMEGKTSFVVAHRLSTIKSADKIIVMKDGKIIETGNHKELIEKGGFYKDLYNSQFQRK